MPKTIYILRVSCIEASLSQWSKTEGRDLLGFRTGYFRPRHAASLKL